MEYIKKALTDARWLIGITILGLTALLSFRSKLMEWGGVVALMANVIVSLLCIATVIYYMVLARKRPLFASKWKHYTLVWLIPLIAIMLLGAMVLRNRQAQNLISKVPVNFDGIVKDVTGHPVVEAQVRVFKADSTDISWPGRVFSTDSHGYFIMKCTEKIPWDGYILFEARDGCRQIRHLINRIKMDNPNFKTISCYQFTFSGCAK